jgi:hypothetical protein
MTIRGTPVTMPTTCPICEDPLAPAATACATCGYPVVFAPDALRALAEPTSGPGEPGPVPAPAIHPHSAPVPDRQSAQCDRLAREIDREIGILVDLGGDPLSVASDLRQAALSEADGRVVEALGILRQASTRVVTQIESLFEARLSEIQRRVARLRTSGVGLAVDEPVGRIQGSVRAGDRAPALSELVRLDEHVTRLEGDFNGLQALLRQIDALRSALAHFAPAPPEVEADVGRVRSLLAAPDLTPAVLEEASLTAAHAVSVLHDSLPPHLESELDRHAGTLGLFPESHEPAQTARALHADVVRHLRRGRLTDAAQRLVELRAAIEELGRTPVPAPARSAPRLAGGGGAAPEASASAEIPDATLQNLLEKARGLAARVRRLPPESEIAFEAASAIRQATELLRSRKLEEADQALSRLMQTLSAEPVGEA